MNRDHKYWITDMNGFLRDTRTAKDAALRTARKLADSTGLDMAVCFNHYRTSHVINVRCRNSDLLKYRRYCNNGQVVIQLPR